MNRIVRNQVFIALVFATAAITTAQDANHESALLSNTRQLTFEGRRSGEGYFSRDGSLMVIQSEREPDNPFYQIYLIDLETGDTQRISPGHGKTTCAWIAPDNRHVLYASTHDDPAARDKQLEELEFRASGRQRRYAWDYDEHYELYLHDRETGRDRRLTHVRGYDAEGAISPDGKNVVFTSNRHAYESTLSPADAAAFERDASLFCDLYLLDLESGATRRLTEHRGYDGGPFFSHDGSRITWRRFSEDGATAEVFVMNADGSDSRQVTRLGAMSWAPYFHPSGEYVIFATNLHGFANFELYLSGLNDLQSPEDIADAARPGSADGRFPPVLRVTHSEGFDGLPVFSPDGQRLAWTSNRTADGSSQIFIADWNHAAAVELLRRAAASVDAISDSTAQVENPRRAGDSIARVETQPEIVADDMRQYVEILAGEAFEGRMTGTPGERLATQFVAEQFQRIGLRPAGDDGGWFQEFTFTAGAELGTGNQLALLDAAGNAQREFTIDVDWRPLAWSRTGRVEPSEIVFAGYGLVVPPDDGVEEYDSFVHLDVTGKWVMVLRYLPEGVTPERRQQLAPFSGLRYKATALRGKGARGMLVVNGPNSGARQPLVPLGIDASLTETGLSAASITDDVADALLQAGGAQRSLKQLQDRLDSGEPMMGFALADARLAGDLRVQRVQRTGRNVVARLPSGKENPRPAVLIGAHVDHLGRGDGGGSLARDGDRDAIHYGADDNASGVAGVLEIAEWLKHLHDRGRLNLQRDVLFAAWSGEELGLLGANHFVATLARASGDETSIRGEISAALNMDMIGRLRDNLIIQGVASSSVWPGLIERSNVPVGLSIAPRPDVYLPTDATSFYLRGAPILSAFTGSHAEYHTPRDTPDTLNYAGAARVARFMGLTLRALATSPDDPDYLEVEPQQRGMRANLRAYLGTIPDYAGGDVPGLKLSGVASGGPADQAGIRAGDVIVQLAGKPIESIYDYTYALEALKVGQEVDVVVQRGDQRIPLKITPGSRD